MARVELDKEAPGFSLQDFNGKTVELSEFAGRSHVLVVFNRGFR